MPPTQVKRHDFTPLLMPLIEVQPVLGEREAHVPAVIEEEMLRWAWGKAPHAEAVGRHPQGE